MAKDNLLSRVTFVVPTYERQGFALRLMDYWADKGPRLIILDGSRAAIASNTLSRFGSHVRYVHNPTGMYQRLQNALEMIETEFVALAGDDEFYIPSAVEACIVELDRDHSLTACCGRAIGFSPQTMKVAGFAQYPRMAGYSIEQDCGSMRVVQHMGNYLPTLVYAICRTGPWKTAWKYITKKEFPFFASSELQFQMCLAHAGRSKVISRLMWLRSHDETVPVRGTDAFLNENLMFDAWWSDRNESGSHREFISLMSGCFEEISPGSGCKSKATIISGLDAYLDYYKRRMYRSNGIVGCLRSLVGPIVPSFSKPLLNEIINLLSLRKRSKAKTLLEFAETLESSGVHVDFHELEEIEKAIMGFHKNRHSMGV